MKFEKNHLLLIVLLLFSVKNYAQNNVGIGTTNPAASAALDITATDKGVLIPRLTKSQRDAIATPATGLMIYQTDNTAGFYHYNGADWTHLSSQLEKITENGKTGYRILGRPPANYGNIGEKALDLSYSETAGTVLGATGNASIAMGFETIASGDYSTAMGISTIASGNGSMAMGNATTASGSFSTTMGVVTKASANYATAMGYNTVASGVYAIAFGASTVASGNASFATGDNSKAPGIISTAIGNSTTASGFSATAMGHNTTASGSFSTAMGSSTKAVSYGETAVGTYNTEYSPTSETLLNTNDRAFGVGIGKFNAPQDGLVVYKSGNTYISNDGNTPATGTTSIIPNLGVAALQVRAKVDGMHILSSAPNHSLTIAKLTEPSAGNRYIALGHINSNTWYETGSITAANGTSVSYNTTSDRRLKTDKGLYINGLSTIKNIKIHNYTWKETNTADIGVFAQELYAAYPNAVTKGDYEGETDPAKIKSRWQVDYSKLVPVLVAATQELEHENAELKSEIELLKQEKEQFEKLVSDLIKRIETVENTQSASLKSN
jgi:Chaperone of endosialidase/Head domain of trimeric autotransporter adhesin